MKIPRILIVEDNPHVLDFLSATLEQHGFISVLASNGEQALRAMALSPVDLAILDHRLPGQFLGVELARLINGGTPGCLSFSLRPTVLRSWPSKPWKRG